MDITRRGKFDTKLWVKDVRRTDSGTAFLWAPVPCSSVKTSKQYTTWLARVQATAQLINECWPYTCAIDGATEKLDPAPNKGVGAHLPPSRHHSSDYNNWNSSLWHLAPI
jgi:hypothetical protein